MSDKLPATAFFTVEIFFRDPEDHSIRRHLIRNLRAGALKQLRGTVFIDGFVIRDPDYPGTEFEIISPFAISKLSVTMQEAFFKPD